MLIVRSQWWASQVIYYPYKKEGVGGRTVISKLPHPKPGLIMPEETPHFRSGFVAVLGRPNVGKSTLVNCLVRHKVAIVTPRPQTTRNRIQGIVNRPHAQVVLIDTPGIHRVDSALGKQMMDEVKQALEGIDVLAVMIDASQGLKREDRLAIDRARQHGGPLFLLLNKVDRMPKPSLLPLLEACGREGIFTEMIPISALTGDGVEIALERFIAFLPEGEPCFPKDQFTDQPERFLAAEIVREKAMIATWQELPQAIAVQVELFEETDKLIKIHAVIQVEREGQKGIIIGRGGETLKDIGTAARKELEEILGLKVFLDLHVRVEQDWREKSRFVRQLDWRHQLEGLTEE
jgi:GTP-binding protein Era